MSLEYVIYNKIFDDYSTLTMKSHRKYHS